MSNLLDKPASSASVPPTELPTAGLMPRNRRWARAVLWGLLHVVTLAVAAAALAGYCGRFGWLCELCSHFRLQYGVLLAACSFGYLAGRRWRVGIATGFLSAANLCLVVSIGVPHPKPEDRTVVRAVLCNVLATNEDHQQLLEFLRTTNPDLVVLVEVSFDWATALHALDNTYPYRRVSPANRGWGMALYSRLPLDDIEQDMIGGDGSALAIVARLRIDGQPLTVIGTHPWSPMSARRLDFRNRQLSDLAALVRRQHGPVVLLADLNTSPWSPYFQDLLSASRLRDSRQGFGFQASWPTYFGFAGIPIDHCLVSPEIAVHQRTIGPNLGSDHFPVVVDFSIWSP
jgi:endonuclease/exonuclease/phosphatase (EEP) superfamily protein YafD